MKKWLVELQKDVTFEDLKKTYKKESKRIIQD